jgi:hypothetical protein
MKYESAKKWLADGYLAVLEGELRSGQTAWGKGPGENVMLFSVVWCCLWLLSPVLGRKLCYLSPFLGHLQAVRRCFG